MAEIETGPEFAGDLMIFVEGYGQDDHRCWELNEPDGFFWGDRGWAVGDNDRGRYCSRQAVHKIRKYRRFDDAVRYVEVRRRKRPKETFFLVYALGNDWTRVSGMDEILALDAAAAGAVVRAAGPSEYARNVARLCELGHSILQARRLAGYLRDIREDGENAASAGMSRSTRMRYARLLEQAGLLASDGSVNGGGAS